MSYRKVMFLLSMPLVVAAVAACGASTSATQTPAPTPSPTQSPTAAPTAAPTSTNPQVAQGAALFQANCAVCHRANGSGGKQIGSAVSADLQWTTLGPTYDNNTSLVARAILHGLDEEGQPLDSVMPHWQGTLTDAQVQDIIAFLQTLPGPSTGPGPNTGTSGSGANTGYGCTGCPMMGYGPMGPMGYYNGSW